jgi:CPA2 family monovalent cation:H+ antiporter-2
MHVEELFIVIAAAALGAALFERFRLPAMVGFLVAGAVVGPGTLGVVKDADAVLRIAEFGVALLLFEIGLELPLDELRRSFRTAVLAGVIQVTVTVAALAGICVAAGLPVETAIVVGMLTALSSTALVMRILAGRGEVDAPHGRLALGILLLQDLAIVPFLLLIPLLAGEVPRELGPMARAIGEALVKIAALWAVARFALPFVLERVARLRSGDLFSLFALLVALGSAVISEELGLGLAVGAFIAGLVVSASPYASQLFAEVAPLRGVLLGVFFTSVGMLLDPAEALANWRGVLVYVGGVVAIKSVVIVGIVAVILRQNIRTAVQTGMALAQTGEFSFVIAAAATAAGLMDSQLAQVFVAGSIVTLMATPFLIRVSPWVAARIPSSGTAPDAAAEPLSEHAIIAGYGLAGRTLAHVLRASGIEYRIVEGNPKNVDRGRSDGEPIVYGDVTRPAVLQHLGVERARLLCLAISDPQGTRSAIEVARALAPNLYVVTRTRYASELDGLFAGGANEVVAEEVEGSIDLVAKVLRRFGIPQTVVTHFAEEMRDEGYELVRGPLGATIDPWLAEILEEVTTEWVEVPAGAPSGRSLESMRVRERAGTSVLAVRRDGNTTTNPVPSFEICAGDALLVLSSGSQLSNLRSILAGEDG